MFRGVFTALITPFKDDGSLDLEQLRFLIEFMAANGISGIVPCGTTGESATLTHHEHRDVIKASVDAAPSKLAVIAGTGSNNTEEAVELTRFAKDVGADASLQITPYYNKPNRRGILKHFNAIAEASDLPIILYNIQSRTGLNLTPDLILELSKDERIIGIKEASGNISQVSKIIELTRDDGFLIFAGDDSSTIPIIALGGVGVVSVAANIIPQRMASLTAEALSGNFDRARDLHYELAPLFDALFLETNPIPVKKAAELMKLSNGTIRLPLAELDKENEARLREVLTEMDLI
ncbi:MAG: 4-hydroxy-tetrahydrodipicolinate synthase [Candidatus Syntropharchaeales archaeon]|nr:4-hydroxy-tetrahydrodipicolinate synthase [Candidatus Syntrophoarchaeum sp.]